MTKFAPKTSLSFCLIALAMLVSHATGAFAQDQQTGSLADAARQARAQKQAQATDGANKAQQIANELSEDQNHPAPSTATASSKDQTTTASGANATSSAVPSNPATAQKSSDSTASNANGQAGATTGDNAHGNPAQATASATQPASAPQAPAKPGPKAQPFNYCKSQNNCWDASVIVPADAKLVSSDCKQYVFETKIKGNPYMLMAGPGGDACSNSNKSNANQVHWGELATPESTLPPGAFNLISSEQTTLDGKPALQIQIGFRKGLTEWMGKRIELENNGVPLVVGCMAPREHFEDGDAVCSAWMQSLRLQ